MMTELKSNEERFLEMLKGIFCGQMLGDALQRLRASAWDHFLDLGLPSQRSEVFQYVRLRQLFLKDYVLSKPKDISFETIEPLILPECRESVLIFINGHLNLSLSCLEGLPKKLVIIPLAEAMRSFGSLLTNQMSERLREEKDPFASLNGALSKEACFIYLPPKLKLDVPLQILNIIDADGEPMMVSPKVELFLGAQAEATFVSTAASLSGEEYFVNSAMNFTLDEGAKASLVQSVLGLPSNSWYFEALRGALKRDSTLKTVSITNGSQGVRFDYRTALIGENAESYLNGLWFLKEKREAHTHVFMDHKAPNCRSMQFFKGALMDFSHSSFEGKIYVRKEAQKTQAFQLNNNLILSDRAQADSKPNLEIFADDVKASHGATVGQLQEDELFYLMARGIKKQDAKALLVHGYCKEIIEMIPVLSLVQKVSKELQIHLTQKE